MIEGSLLSMVADFLPGFRDRDFVDLLAKCSAVLDKKGSDYTGGIEKTEPTDHLGYNNSTSRLKNFYVNGERLGLAPRQVLGVYMNKHFDAIQTFLAKGQVESEPIEERLVDAVNYLFLLYKLVQVEKRLASVAADAPPPSASQPWREPRK